MINFVFYILGEHIFHNGLYRSGDGDLMMIFIFIGFYIVGTQYVYYKQIILPESKRTNASKDDILFKRILSATIFIAYIVVSFSTVFATFLPQILLPLVIYVIFYVLTGGNYTYRWKYFFWGITFILYFPFALLMLIILFYIIFPYNQLQSYGTSTSSDNGDYVILYGVLWTLFHPFIIFLMYTAGKIDDYKKETNGLLSKSIRIWKRNPGK